MSYTNYEINLGITLRYIEQLWNEIHRLEPNLALLSSIARTTAQLTEAMLANQTLPAPERAR